MGYHKYMATSEYPARWRHRGQREKDHIAAIRSLIRRRLTGQLTRADYKAQLREAHAAHGRADMAEAVEFGGASMRQPPK
jgi:hypothetical protein